MIKSIGSDNDTIIVPFIIKQLPVYKIIIYTRKVLEYDAYSFGVMFSAKLST